VIENLHSPDTFHTRLGERASANVRHCILPTQLANQHRNWFILPSHRAGHIIRSTIRLICFQNRNRELIHLCFLIGEYTQRWKFHIKYYPGFQRIFFLLLILMVRSEARLTRKKITQPHFHVRNQFRIWTGSPTGCSHVKLFDVANQGVYYIVNSLRTSNRWPSSNSELISHMEMRLRTPVTRGYFFPR